MPAHYYFIHIKIGIVDLFAFSMSLKSVQEIIQIVYVFATCARKNGYFLIQKKEFQRRFVIRKKMKRNDLKKKIKLKK